MKASSLPNLNRETPSFPNFFTLYLDSDHEDDTTLHKRRKVYHRQDTEASETSPFKDIPSPLVSFNEMNENHYTVGRSFYEWDWDQMDRTLPGWPPSPNGSDTNVSVGSNQFISDVGACLEGPNFTQLLWDQTLPSTSSVGSYSSSVTQLRRGCYNRRVATQTWTITTSNLVDDGHAWRKYGQKLILNASHPREYYRCWHMFDQGCQATKQVQRTNEDPPIYQITYHGNHSCGDPTKAPHIILDSTIPNDGTYSNIIDRSTYNYNPLNNISKVETMGGFENCFPGKDLKVVDWDLEEYKQSGDTSNLIDDGHEWRMYGQKLILGTIYPRNYFRCTHKFDQACPATKQVQRTDENLPMFQTTYHGNHTCRNPPAPHLIGESVPLDANC